ncbi:MAG: 4Fe-4S binding protein [Desulfatibacillum sp.]|nr:4Fe-4S binding protein [Desulfatibacillum sp.]
MLIKIIREFDIFTFLSGLAMQRLYGRDKKLPKFVRRALLFGPEHFAVLGRIGFLRKRMAVFDPAKSNFSMIPINQDIEGAEDQALPIEIIDALIDRSSHRAILSKCVCRVNYDCQKYPDDHACLFLGESALDTPKKWRRIVSKDEAKAHARKGVGFGLVPMVGKIRFDSDTLGIQDRGKLMTICFCCECCCLSRFLAPLPPELVDSLQHPVEGISIEITEDCIGCGECVDVCYLNALEIVDGKVHRKDICRVCGRCAATCKQKAIKIRLDNPNVVEDVVARLLSVVTI